VSDNTPVRRFQGHFAIGKLFLWYLVFSGFGLVSAQVCGSECGMVAGKVREPMQSSMRPVPNVKLSFIDKSWSRYETRTDELGGYEIKLPTGTYWMEVLKDGTCRIQKPDVRVSSGESLHFDLELVSCDSVDGPAQIAETLVIPSSQGITEPLPSGLTLKELRDPIYPRIPQAAAIQGEVKLTVYVNPDGTVASVDVESGHQMLKSAAVESATASHFECRGCGDGLWPYSLTYQFQIVPSNPEQYCNSTLAVLSPKLDSERHQVTVPAWEEWTCDEVAQIRRERVRSAKCFYLWKCGLRPLE
jgi:TonB family protein